MKRKRVSGLSNVQDIEDAAETHTGGEGDGAGPGGGDVPFVGPTALQPSPTSQAQHQIRFVELDLNYLR